MKDPTNNLFQKLNDHLLNDDRPSKFLREIVELPDFKSTKPYSLLYQLTLTEQNPTHHPEGNVWEHTLQVVDVAARFKHLSSQPEAFMWASLLHDIGKATTTKKRGGKITSYNHDVEGAQMATHFLKEVTHNIELVNTSSRLVRWHMQPLFIQKNLPYARIQDMLADIAPSEIGLFSLCDRLGRNKDTMEDLKYEVASVTGFLKLCYEQTKDALERDRILKLIHQLAATTETKV
ncbi:MAG: HDIG domain-containing protein [Vallitaleaceae bacterium]|nr:HDIG domain-containing protein [Vallitaleaceae bacterium]